jgi:hypothetical protein
MMRVLLLLKTTSTVAPRLHALIASQIDSLHLKCDAICQVSIMQGEVVCEKRKPAQIDTFQRSKSNPNDDLILLEGGADRSPVWPPPAARGDLHAAAALRVVAQGKGKAAPGHAQQKGPGEFGIICIYQQSSLKICR